MKRAIPACLLFAPVYFFPSAALGQTASIVARQEPAPTDYEIVDETDRITLTLTRN
jgi:hypothetical protein